MKKITNYLSLIVISLLIVLIGTKCYSYARYAVTTSFNYYLESKDFYFSSDELNGQNNINSNWDGNKTYFTIKNSINDDRVTEYDISYTVKCNVIGDDSIDCAVNGSDKNTYSGVLSYSMSCKTSEGRTLNYTQEECSEQGYTYTYIPSSKELYFELTKDNGEEITGATVEIEVKSTKPFSKTLKSKFILNKGKTEIGSLELKYNKDIINDMLIITNTYKENKCVKLTFNNEDLRIDVDVNNLISYKEVNGYINEIIFTINSNKSVNYIFYKTNNNEINEQSFLLVEVDEC